MGYTDPEVSFEAHDWFPQCEQLLVTAGRVRLVAPVEMILALRDSIVAILTRPIDTGSLLVYPRLRGIDRQLKEWQVLLDIVVPGQVAPPQDIDQEAVTSRLIVKTAKESREEVRDLLESLFAAELLSPGAEIWLVSPWISDLPLLDNRSGAYSGLEPAWPKRKISLAELLAYALRANPRTVVRIVTRPDVRNARFCRRVRHLVDLDGNADRLAIDDKRPELHSKGLATGSYALIGSMNFTMNGITVLEETVQLDSGKARVGQFFINLHEHYPFLTPAAPR